MPRHTFPHDAHAQGLRDELLAASIPVSLVNPLAGGGVEVDVPDEWLDRAAAVVAAHDPSTYTAQEDAARTNYDQAVQTLKQFRQLTPGSATNAQRDRAIQAATTILQTQHQQLREQGAAAAP